MLADIQKRILDIITEDRKPEQEILAQDLVVANLTETVDYFKQYMKQFDGNLVIPSHKYKNLFESISLNSNSDEILLEGVDYKDAGGDLWNIFMLEDGPYYGIEEPMMKIPLSWTGDVSFYKTALTRDVVKNLCEAQVAPIVTMAAAMLMVSWMIADDLFTDASIFSQEMPAQTLVLEVSNQSSVVDRFTTYIDKVYNLPDGKNYLMKVADISYKDQNGRAQDVFFSNNGPPMCGLDKPQYKIVPQVIDGKQYYIFEKN
jgi:hypothetical protein